MRTVFAALLLVFTLGATAAEVEIVNVMPVAGSVGGGDLVEISGALDYEDRCDPFPCYTNPDVFFGDTRAEVLIADGRRIVVRTPPHAPGAVTVRVDIAGYKATALQQYLYIDATQDPYPSNYEQVLVPVAVTGAPLPGAYGSVWISELWATNDGPRRVELFTSYPRCSTDCAGKPFPGIDPGQSMKLTLPNNRVSDAYLLWVQRGGIDDVTLSLRIRDTSRFDDNHGTEIPLPRVSEFQRKATLVNVPIDSRGRTSLRVYSDAGHVRSVTVRVDVTSLTGPEILASRLLELTEPVLEPALTRMFHAQFGALGDLRLEFPNLPEGTYRITVTPVEPVFIHTVFPLVSVTNNRTQLVTAIAPQQQMWGRA
jgi:hypothetical protein